MSNELQVMSYEYVVGYVITIVLPSPSNLPVEDSHSCAFFNPIAIGSIQQ